MHVVAALTHPMRSPADVEFSLQVTYAAACVTAWLTWDAAVHFDVEVECIWRRPRSWVKWVYAFIRYTPILHGGALLALDRKTGFTTSGCKGWIYHELIFVEVLTFVVEAILVMRLYVLYNENKIILWMMVLSFVAEVVMMVLCLAIVLPRLTFSPDCLVASVPGIFMTYWLSSLAFETFLFILTLTKFFQNVSRSFGKSSILFIFVRDGTWAFALIFVAMLLNMLMYKLNKTPLVGMGYGWAFACMSFAGSHVLLNLRRLAVPQDSDAQTLTALVFSPAMTAPGTTIVTAGVTATHDSEVTVVQDVSQEMEGNSARHYVDVGSCQGLGVDST